LKAVITICVAEKKRGECAAASKIFLSDWVYTYRRERK
jgi:hypothetical protein